MKYLRLTALVFSLLLISRITGTVHAVIESPKSVVQISNESEYKDKYIVVYKNHLLIEQSVQGLKGRHPELFEVFHTYSLLPAASMRLSPLMLEAVRRDPGVESIHEVMQVTIQLDESVPQISGPQAQALGFDGSGVKVCVVDTGVDDSHYALPPLYAEYDFVNNDGNAYDDNGHGTHVAGIVASQDSRYGGVAPGATLLAAKVLNSSGSGGSDDIIAGIDWCVAQGADVINMSLGGGVFTGSCDGNVLAQFSNLAVDAGVTVLAASGNNGWENRMLSPSCGSKVIAVGAVDKDDSRGSYSNGGQELDVTAPGTSIRSTLPGNSFGRLTGTSMATPHAAAVASLIIQKTPDLTPSEVRSVLRSSSVDLGDTGFDFDFGHGRVDALAAVLADPDGDGGGDDGGGGGNEVVEVFSEDFEQGLSKWNAGGWWIQSPSERSVPGSAQGNNVAHSEACRNSCTLSLKNPIDLTQYEKVTLSFWRFVDRSLDRGEFLAVEIFDGSAWQQVAYWTNRNGDDDKWNKETIDITGLRSADFSIRFISKENSSIEDVEVDDVVITGEVPAEKPPIADAGEDQTVGDGDDDGLASVTLDGSDSSDPDGNIVSYEWKKGGVTVGTTAVITQVLLVETHVFTLIVTDNDGLTDDDTVQIIVTENQDPVADAGLDQIKFDSDGNGVEPVTLDGSSSTDDGSIASYVWKEEGSVIGSGAVISKDFAVGTHTITLTVTDNVGRTDSDSVDVNVNPNEPPVPKAGEDQEILDVDKNGSEQITLDGSESYDADGTIVSYIWRDGSGSVIGSDAVISKEFAVGTHNVTLTVTDNGGESDVDTVIIKVLENVTPPGPIAVFSDDFQSGLGKWQQSGDGNWGTEDPDEPVPGFGTGNKVAHADRCRSSNGCILTMLDSVDLSAFSEADLSFWRFVDRGLDNGEFFAVDAFDGVGWNNLFYWTHRAGDDDEWNEEKLALDSKYLHSSFRIRIRLRASAFFEFGEIDDVLVEGR